MLGFDFNFKTAVEFSKNYINQIKNEYVFNSKTLQRFFKTGFMEEGTNPNSIYAISRTTNKPVEIFVEPSQEPFFTYYNIYDFRFFDNNKNAIGLKHFMTQTKNNTTTMLPGYMESKSCEIVGLGVIEDALQIETALSLGIRNIPRKAAAKATLYHTKMGYLPTPHLEEVKNRSEVLDLINDCIRKSRDIQQKNFKPIIVENNEKYYMDTNATQAYANLSEVEERLAQSGANRLDNLKAPSTELELSGERLNTWIEAIKKHSLLQKLA